MSNFIFYADRLVSVANPYLYDNFVQSHHRVIRSEEVPGLLKIYKEVSQKNKLLVGLIDLITQRNKLDSVSVIDVGVFMGSFSTGVAFAGKRAGVDMKINAYEANPMLIPSIIKNFQLYGVNAFLHWGGVGSKYGSQEFVVSEGATIG